MRTEIGVRVVEPRCERSWSLEEDMAEYLGRKEIEKLIDERANTILLYWEKTSMQPRHEENQRTLAAIQHEQYILSEKLTQIYGNGSGRQGMLEKMEEILNRLVRGHAIADGERRRGREIKNWITWILGALGTAGGILEVIVRIHR